MKRQRLFFTLLFLVGLGIGAIYLRDFIIKQHPSISGVLTKQLVIFTIGAVIVQLLGHLVRAYKSRLLLGRIRKAKTRTLFKGLSVGFLFNTLLPFRLGELVRAYYVGEALVISKTAVFVSIIIERIVDGFILGVCFISAGLAIRNISKVAESHLLHFGYGLLGLSSLLGFLIYLLRSENKHVLKFTHSSTSIFNSAISNRMRFMAWSGIYGTRLMLRRNKDLRRYLALSLGMWLLYFGSTAIVALAYFGSLSAAKLWFITQVTYVGVSAPAGPGYIGTFHIIVSKLLADIGLSSVGGFSLIMWPIMVAPISLIGLYVLQRQRFGVKQVSEKNQELINKLHRDTDISTEMAHFLGAYFKGEKLNQILTHAELEDKFKLIKSYRGGSNAHTMLVWQNDEMHVKKITLPQFSDKLEAQARWLEDRAGLKHIPKVTGREKTDNHYYFDIAYREEYYPFFEYIHSHSADESYAILKKIIRFMDNSIYHGKSVKGGKQKLVSYIDKKIIQKVNDTSAISNTIGKLMTHEKIKVNGVEYDNLLTIVNKIKRNKKAMRELASYKEGPIHGDLTIDNIIVSDEGDFLVIDPNNENDVSTKVVDLGKLYQSLHSGYEFLIQLESCAIQKHSINFEDSKSHKYAEVFKMLDKKLKKDMPPAEYRAILFHQAVHYCRMLTYRVGIDSHTVPVFYATAVKLFNEYLMQYE